MEFLTYEAAPVVSCITRFGVSFYHSPEKKSHIGIIIGKYISIFLTKDKGDISCSRSMYCRILPVLVKDQSEDPDIELEV